MSQPVKRDAVEVSNRIWTIPNALSFLRLLGVPVFFVLIIRQYDIAAVVLLAVASLTDWVDGRIARRFNQITRLGQMLDPAADRLYIFATVLGLAIREIIPWWLLALLVGRDLMLALFVLPALRSRGYASLPVNFIGKAGTFCLLYALPLVLLGAGPWVISPASRIIGWAFAIWGVYLYWWAGLMYLKQSRELVGRAPASPGR
ncbi:MAG: CDP-alcohol phosphatidyltransferase family protein [Brooklawnia sp.]|nr:CDP-alcohol phosphatidyltransferase family protein [Brooklawnia sp.]